VFAALLAFEKMGTRPFCPETGSCRLKVMRIYQKKGWDKRFSVFWTTEPRRYGAHGATRRLFSKLAWPSAQGDPSFPVFWTTETWGTLSSTAIIFKNSMRALLIEALCFPVYPTSPWFNSLF